MLGLGNLRCRSGVLRSDLFASEDNVDRVACFGVCAEFCERWDQSSFDPNYPARPLGYFEPMIREVFDRKAYDPGVMREGKVTDLPPLAA